MVSLDETIDCLEIKQYFVHYTRVMHTVRHIQDVSEVDCSPIFRCFVFIRGLTIANIY
jgi:hypothetical protein